jgi:Flp pilus assembly protein TadG
MTLRHKYLQRGAAMVGTALVMGFLIFMIISSIDLFFLSAAYSTYSQIAREGVIAGVRMDSFFNSKNGSCDVSTNGVTHTDLQNVSPQYQNCADGQLGTCGHYALHWRIKKALDAFRSTRVSNPSMSTTCRELGTKSIEVRLDATFNGYSPAFRNIAISVRQRGEMVT